MPDCRGNHRMRFLACVETTPIATYDDCNANVILMS
jgi:hypothetical protein